MAIARTPQRYLLIGALCIMGAYALSVTQHRTEKILVATEAMGGETFNKSIIVIGGSWLRGWSGVIVNKPLAVDAQQNIPENIRGLSIDVGYGGPVGFPDTLLLLERQEDVTAGKTAYALRKWDDAVRDAPDLLERVRRDAQEHTRRYRLFLGYSGWGTLQLENEFAQTPRWEDMPTDPDIVWQNGTEVSWEDIRRKQREKRAARYVKTL